MVAPCSSCEHASHVRDIQGRRYEFVLSYPRIGNYCHRCRKVCDGTPKIKEISMQTPISELSNGVFDVYDANGKAIARLGFGNYLSMDIAIGQFEVRGFP